MADALCGPSNPLQQFKQQTQHDRSLQQDRLTSRHTPAQGFRSLDPNAGLLDPEFEAFQAGLPPSELPNFPAFHPQSSRLAGPSQAPSWAADFQRMQISSPPPFRQQQQYTPQPSHGGSNWAQGFREQVSQTTPRTQHAAPSPQAFQYMARHGMNGYQNNFAQPNYAQPIQSNGKQPVTEQFDEAAFEQAFDQARDALQAEEQPQNDAEMAQESAYINGASTGNMDQDYASAESLVGQVEGASQLEQSLSDAEREAIRDYNSQLENLQRLGGTSVAAEQLRAHDIQAEDQQMEDIKQPNDDDALAATAEELLQKVEHNQTDKFRNSQFLGLMRKLRDREVKVEGDKMVETVRPPLSKHVLPPPSAPDSTYGSGTATPDPVFNNGDFRRTPHSTPPEFDSHEELGWSEEHQFDHWESPYR